jgi:hypothetical protein
MTCRPLHLQLGADLLDSANRAAFDQLGCAGVFRSKCGVGSSPKLQFPDNDRDRNSARIMSKVVVLPVLPPPLLSQGRCNLRPVPCTMEKRLRDDAARCCSEGAGILRLEEYLPVEVGRSRIQKPSLLDHRCAFSHRSDFKPGLIQECIETGDWKAE